MPLNQPLIAELKQEAASTRRILERVPEEHNDWKPHEKSMKLGRLATHIAELESWIYMIMATEELDFAKFDYKPTIAESTADLLAKHDENVAQSMSILETSTDEDFTKPWTLRNGEHIIFTMPRINAIRSFAFNHIYHHRGQLSVYLRLLNVAVPGMYGPTADDVPAAATATA